MNEVKYNGAAVFLMETADLFSQSGMTAGLPFPLPLPLIYAALASLLCIALLPVYQTVE